MESERSSQNKPLQNKTPTIIGLLFVLLLVAYYSISRNSEDSDVKSEDRTPIFATKGEAGVTEPRSIAPIFAIERDVYFADAFKGDSSVIYHRSADGSLQEFYVRSNGGIHYIAVSPEGIVHFTDANRRTIYKVVGNEALKVYTHRTKVSDINFDSRGWLYFSESNGAEHDGYIYRLENSKARRIFKIELAKVDGYWAGTFALDLEDTVWLSSGNLVPAYLYKIDGNGAIERVWTRERSIAGFFFDSENSLVFAEWRGGLYRLDMETMKEYVLQNSPLDNRISDVESVSVATVDLDSSEEHLLME